MKLRDYIKDRLNIAEELSQYREFAEEVSVSIQGCTATAKRVQKFILHNGQQKIIAEDFNTVNFSNRLPGVGGDSIKIFNNAGNSESRIFTPLNTALNEIEPILDIIPQITTCQSNNMNYVSQNTRLTTDITGIKQRTTDFQNQANKLQTQINSFQIVNTIKTFNAKQKAHILQKIWGSSDSDSVNILNAIKQQGFDPHYVHKNGQSLVTFVLNRNDVALFDLLISNKLDFNNLISGKTVFQTVLAGNNNNITNKMFATNQDFSKSVLNIALSDNGIIVNKIFSYKPELSKVSYAGYSLLQLLLKKGNYPAAEQVLKTSADTITQLCSKNLSSVQLCLIWENKQGIELLKKYGVNLENELKSAINHKYINIINKILTTEPELIKSLVNLDSNNVTEALLQNAKLLDVVSSNGDNLLHLTCKIGNYELASRILASKPSCINQQNKDKKTVFHTLLETPLESSVKAQFAKLFLSYKPDVNLPDSKNHTITELATENAPDILAMIYEYNLIGENN